MLGLEYTGRELWRTFGGFPAAVLIWPELHTWSYSGLFLRWQPLASVLLAGLLTSPRQA